MHPGDAVAVGRVRRPHPGVARCGTRFMLDWALESPLAAIFYLTLITSLLLYKLNNIRRQQLHTD